MNETLKNNTKSQLGQWKKKYQEIAISCKKENIKMDIKA